MKKAHCFFEKNLPILVEVQKASWIYFFVIDQLKFTLNTMPKSKRDRKIALSKTTKKVGLETKQVFNKNNISISSIFKNT